MFSTTDKRSRVNSQRLHRYAEFVGIYLVFLSFWSFAGRTYAQIAGTGTIQGSVTDTSGALIPGAQIRIVEVTTNAERDTTTSNSGFYSVGHSLTGCIG